MSVVVVSAAVLVVVVVVVVVLPLPLLLAFSFRGEVFREWALLLDFLDFFFFFLPLEGEGCGVSTCFRGAADGED